MKKYLYAALFITSAMLAGCSKSEPEPEPAEQVIGSYTVEKLTEAIKYANSASEYAETTNYPVKGTTSAGIGYEVNAVLDVAKTASNIVTVTFTQTAKLSNGQTEKSNSAFTGIELKKIEGTSGEFDMLDTGVKIGSIGKNAITIEEVTNDKDSSGVAYTYTFRITGKKAQ
jgi:membrane-bound lytic murein transglycosylase